MDEKGQEAGRPIEDSGSLSRLGNCLRASFTADNHDSLGDGITRSLLHLSREEKTPPMRQARWSCLAAGPRGLGRLERIK
jgi:hypothetical protein